MPVHGESGHLSIFTLLKHLTLTYLGYFASLNSWGGAIMAPP